MLDAFDRFKQDKEADEIRQWRHATDRERLDAILKLMDWAEDLVEMRGRPHVPELLPTNWLHGKRG